MVARAVIKWPDPRLLKKSADVDPTSKDTHDLALDLYHTMVASFGAGIAASQIGVHKNVCLVSCHYAPSLPAEEKLSNAGRCVALVNPKLTVIGNEKFKWEESCLSVPDITSLIDRDQKVSLKYYNLSGDLIEKVLEGTESATLQHETDHLIGKLFIHRLTGATRRVTLRKLRRKILKQKKTIAAEKKEAKSGSSSLSEERRQILRSKRRKKRKKHSKNKR
mgnify:CR=1 FL=1